MVTGAASGIGLAYAEAMAEAGASVSLTDIDGEGAEREAAREGKTLLVLDTATGSDAERLYQRDGWVRVGDIPNYARWPEGPLCGTTVYYKPLSP